MKVLLTTLNSKYSHLSLALRYLRAVLRQNPALEVTLQEFTVNQGADDILPALYAGAYDCVCFSTYIWNVRQTLQLAGSLKKIRPDTRILLGGPEVTHAPASILKDHPYIDGLILGEGEDTLKRLLEAGFDKPGWQSLAGTAWNTEGGLRINPAAQLIAELDTIPFPYDEGEDFSDRLVYYESSRGCPYHCTYCLSSAEEGVRFFSLPRVFKDLQWLLAQNIRTVKFVDRTFNLDPARYLPIIDFIEAHDNGRTCFHFEISAGILPEEAIRRFTGLRKGLVQFEIGVQSTCPEALRASGRPDWTEAILKNAAQLRAGDNIHIHLDLIAGLPHEGYERFLESFDAVYRVRPHLLQLGFLKLIKGTAMRRKAAFYGFQWQEEAPYEVLESKWLTYGELVRLKQLEQLLDRYYQGGRFQRTMPLLESRFETPSAFYTALGAWWTRNGHWDRSVGQDEGWLLLLAFAEEAGLPAETVREALRWDCVRHWKPKGFAGTPLGAREPEKALQHGLLQQRDKASETWAPYGSSPVKELLKQLHFEVFVSGEAEANGVIWCFDTRQKPAVPLMRWSLAEARALMAADPNKEREDSSLEHSD